MPGSDGPEQAAPGRGGPGGVPVPDAWASGAAYEPYVGRWSRPVAREFISWLAVPPGGRWLDVGCGTGALAETVLALAAPAAVVAVDRSPEYASFARERLPGDRCRVLVGDAGTLPVETGAFDAVVSGLVLNFLPDPARGVAEMTRAALPGGVVAAYVWDYAAGMEMIRRFWDAAVALDPRAGDLDEGVRFPICAPEPLADLMGSHLTDVAVRAVDVPTPFRDFDDLWSPFLGGQAPAPSYVASLDADSRAALRERLRASLTVAPDGSIALTARAWAARGRVP